MCGLCARRDVLLARLATTTLSGRQAAYLGQERRKNNYRPPPRARRTTLVRLSMVRARALSPFVSLCPSVSLCSPLSLLSPHFRFWLAVPHSNPPPPTLTLHADPAIAALSAGLLWKLPAETRRLCEMHIRSVRAGAEADEERAGWGGVGQRTTEQKKTDGHEQVGG